MANKWATPSLIAGLASVAVFPVNTVLPAILGAAAAVFGSFGIRRNTGRTRSAIGMVLGFLVFVLSGNPQGW